MYQLAIYGWGKVKKFILLHFYRTSHRKVCYEKLEEICKIHKKTDENSPIFSKVAGVGLQLWQK